MIDFCAWIGSHRDKIWYYYCCLISQKQHGSTLFCHMILFAWQCAFTAGTWPWRFETLSLTVMMLQCSALVLLAQISAIVECGVMCVQCTSAFRRSTSSLSSSLRPVACMTNVTAWPQIQNLVFVSSKVANSHTLRCQETCILLMSDHQCLHYWFGLNA